MHLTRGNLQDEPVGDGGVDFVKTVLDGMLLGDDEIRVSAVNVFIFGFGGNLGTHLRQLALYHSSQSP
jgi:hypothetical protein